MKLLPIVVIAALLQASCAAQPDTASSINKPSFGYRCQSYGGFSEDVCMVSMFRLAAHPVEYDEKLVAFNGYAKKVEGNMYIFPTQEFSDANDFSVSVVCYSESSDVCRQFDDGVIGYVTTFGEFSDDVPIGDWVIRPIGRVDALEVRRRRPPQ